MSEITPVGWIAIAGIVLMLVSVFVGQSQNKAMFKLANIMTLLGALGIGIGVFYWAFLS